MRSVLLYVLLVGLPALAVSGVLRVGQRLQSPIFVGGSWKVERDSSSDPHSACGHSLIPDRAVLTISQSGSKLLLRLSDEDGTTFAGEIHDATITATLARAASDASLDAQGLSGASIQLHATVERENGLDRLLGALTVSDCPTSTVTSFRAKRQAAIATQRK